MNDVYALVRFAIYGLLLVLAYCVLNFLSTYGLL